jgi:hypothetical protein
MHNIHMAEVTEDFAKCWKAAGVHIQSQVQGEFKSWLRAHINPPFLEHLSFRLGNQLFYIRIQDVDDELEIPGSLKGLLSIANGSKGHACLMPMKKIAGNWTCATSGWGLVSVETEASINPVDFISDEQIEMTDWELQDFAVQVVRKNLEDEGRQLMSWQGNPSVDPSIWFVGDDGPEWVIVRAFRHGPIKASKPNNWKEIVSSLKNTGSSGNYAEVTCASPDDVFDPTGDNAAKLFRGQGLRVRYLGLEKEMASQS